MVVLAGGGVVEAGDHLELLERRGAYARMHAGFTDGGSG
jgi:ABC-type transport system involved in Fe-S cluster assembly fused permease/ATPase subunit